MEVIRSSETSVHIWTTRRYIPEYGNFQIISVNSTCTHYALIIFPDFCVFRLFTGDNVALGFLHCLDVGGSYDAPVAPVYSAWFLLISKRLLQHVISSKLSMACPVTLRRCRIVSEEDISPSPLSRTFLAGQVILVIKLLAFRTIWLIFLMVILRPSGQMPE
jgi:hypothetical protein